MIPFFIKPVTTWWLGEQRNENIDTNQMPDNIVLDPFLKLKHLNFPFRPTSRPANVFKHDVLSANPVQSDRDESDQIDERKFNNIDSDTFSPFNLNRRKGVGQPLLNQKAHTIVRKEIRALSPKELSNYLLAVYKLHKEGLIDDLSLLHLACEHYAHNNPRFLPWHRAFLLYYEMLLKLMVKDVVLPYWDWSLDAKNVKKSMVMKIWPVRKNNSETGRVSINEILNAQIEQNKKDTYGHNKKRGIGSLGKGAGSEKDENYFNERQTEKDKRKKKVSFGKANGSEKSVANSNDQETVDFVQNTKSNQPNMKIGLFKDEIRRLKHLIPKEYRNELCWKVNIPESHCLKRSDKFDFLYETVRIKKMIQKPFDQFASPFEIVPHAIVHLVIGGNETDNHIGDMAMLYSCNDPIFFLHHSYCDYIWQAQQYRQRVEKLKDMIMNGHKITKRLKSKIKKTLKAYREESEVENQNNTSNYDKNEKITKDLNETIKKNGIDAFIKNDLFNEPDFLYEILTNYQFEDLMDKELSDYTSNPDEQLFPFNMTVRDIWHSNVHYEPYKINYHYETKDNINVHSNEDNENFIRNKSKKNKEKKKKHRSKKNKVEVSSDDLKKRINEISPFKESDTKENTQGKPLHHSKGGLHETGSFNESDTKQKDNGTRPLEVKEIPESFIKRHRYDKRKVRRMERMINERETTWDRIMGI